MAGRFDLLQRFVDDHWRLGHTAEAGGPARHPLLPCHPRNAAIPTAVSAYIMAAEPRKAAESDKADRHLAGYAAKPAKLAERGVPV